MFKLFLILVNTQFSATVKIFRSDSGGEYMSNDFQSFLQTKGIISQRSCSYTPQQNRVAGRKNRHLLDVVRTLLIETSIPSKFWVEALTTTTYLINRLPSQILSLKSSYFCLHHCHPIYTNLHTFGYICFMHLPPPHRNKLSAQSIHCAFLGYSVTQRVIYVLIHTLIGFMFSEMLFSLKINVSFPCLHHQPPLLSICLLLMTLLICTMFKLTSSSHIWCIGEDFQCCPLLRPKRQVALGSALRKGRAAHTLCGDWVCLAQRPGSPSARCPLPMACSLTKTCADYFLPNHPFNAKCTLAKKTTSPIPRYPCNSLCQGLSCHYTAPIYSTLCLCKQ